MSSVINKTLTFKQTLLWHSIVPSETNIIQSQQSSNTTTHYCYKHLENTNVYIHINPLKNIQAAIKNIINTKLSGNCHIILYNKAKKFSKRCKKMVQAAISKNDFIYFFYIFIEDINSDNLIFLKKANWQVELKIAI